MIRVKPKHEHTPGAPLYARRALVFSGVCVARGSEIPPTSIKSPRRHFALWRSGAATHIKPTAKIVAELTPIAEPLVVARAESIAPRPEPPKPKLHPKR